MTIANTQSPPGYIARNAWASLIGRPGENQKSDPLRSTAMTEHDLHSVSHALVAARKGILAADETVPTLTKRFDSLGIPSTEQSRRTYRQMLFTSSGAAEFISGAIMHDETIRQKSAPRQSQWRGECREIHR